MQNYDILKQTLSNPLPHFPRKINLEKKKCSAVTESNAYFSIATL
jgi:hypothetical protein